MLDESRYVHACEYGYIVAELRDGLYLAPMCGGASRLDTLAEVANDPRSYTYRSRLRALAAAHDAAGVPLAAPDTLRRLYEHCAAACLRALAAGEETTP